MTYDSPSRMGQQDSLNYASLNYLIIRPQRVGSWWDAQAQIDVAAVNDEYMLLGECRWRSRPLGLEVLTELQQKAARAPGGRHPVLVLFSRSGFTAALQTAANAQGVLLVGLEGMSLLK